MSPEDAEFGMILAVIGEFYATHTPSSRGFNTQKIARFIRKRIGAKRLPASKSGRVFSKLYDMGILQRDGRGRKRGYYAHIIPENLVRAIQDNMVPEGTQFVIYNPFGIDGETEPQVVEAEIAANNVLRRLGLATMSDSEQPAARETSPEASAPAASSEPETESSTSTPSTKALVDDISISYTIEGEVVTDSFWRKFSGRFTPVEKGVTYTFRGINVPSELHPLVESVLES
tara:strand:- start:67 stop:759 length:693 start_codon:yes stop_codon:yes gene_type:complete